MVAPLTSLVGDKDLSDFQDDFYCHFEEHGFEPSHASFKVFGGFRVGSAALQFAFSLCR